MAELPEVSLRHINIADIRGSRCRLQRLRDLKFFSGWIKSATLQELSIEIKGEASLAEGDSFHVEAAIEASNISFPCLLKRREGNICWLDVSNTPTISTPGQEPRYQASDIRVQVKTQHGLLDAEAIDISQGGIGILTNESIPSLTHVRVTVQGRGANVSARGLVRYCRPDNREKTEFRVGIQVEFDDRLSKALWQRLAMTSVENSTKAA